jgi:hypothetical protein
MDNTDELVERTNEQETLATRELIGEGTAQTPGAWEMIAPGRYMPRRVRGSCHGRELG